MTIDDFMRSLADCREQVPDCLWNVGAPGSDDPGALRASCRGRREGGCFCPVTFLAHALGHATDLGGDEFDDAADAMGLAREDAARIVAASDFDYEDRAAWFKPEVAEDLGGLRRRLVEAVGLGGVVS